VKDGGKRARDIKQQKREKWKGWGYYRTGEAGRKIKEKEKKKEKKTHKLRLPAIRGCVAHDPPSTTLCFPSKKSAVYPG
jgi:hypothetical protein